MTQTMLIIIFSIMFIHVAMACDSYSVNYTYKMLNVVMYLIFYCLCRVEERAVVKVVVVAKPVPRVFEVRSVIMRLHKTKKEKLKKETKMVIN